MKPIREIRPVVQQDVTGCAIACAAALAGKSYPSTRALARRLGIEVGDASLWSSTAPMRRLLAGLGIPASGGEVPFSGWDELPDVALLAIKWRGGAVPCWHWVLFIRRPGGPVVIDPKKSLKKNIRTDFGRMHPRWFMQLAV